MTRLIHRIAEAFRGSDAPPAPHFHNSAQPYQPMVCFDPACSSPRLDV